MTQTELYDKLDEVTAERDALASRLASNLDHVEQARRDLRQAIDIIESGRDDSEAFRVVRLRIHQAGKQLAGVVEKHESLLDRMAPKIAEGIDKLGADTKDALERAWFSKPSE